MYKLCANWVMVSCYNSVCTKDIQEIKRQNGLSDRKNGGIVTSTAKNPKPTTKVCHTQTPNTHWDAGAAAKLGPHRLASPQNIPVLRKCPHGALPCRGVVAFAALSWDVPRDGTAAAQAAASWGLPVHPQCPSPFQSHPWHWFWHSWSPAAWGTSESRTESAWAPPWCSSRDWRAHGPLWRKAPQPGYTSQEHKSSGVRIFQSEGLFSMRNS